MSVPDPRDFLAELAAYVAAQNAGSAHRPARLATVSPTYTSGKPEVTFDGDLAVADKSLPYLASYTPTAGDRVLVLPVGNTYVILGEVLNS